MHSIAGGGPDSSGDAILDVTAILDRNPIGAAQLKIIALCCATSLLDGFDTMVMSFLAPSISQEWHASHGAFGIVFSATLLGGAIGATGFGLLADRFGRKALILAAVTWFAALTLGCAFSMNLQQLIGLRFLAGVGLGGAIPNILALAGEYAPARRRSTVVAIVTWGTPLGAVLGGLLAGPMVQAWGWRSVMLLAGIAPVALLPGLLLAMPESARFLALSPTNAVRLRALLADICPRETIPSRVQFSIAETTRRRSGLDALFRDGLGWGTTLLSAAMFMSLVLSFFLVNWSPTLLSQAGLPMKDAILGTIVLNLSGVIGSLFIARWIDGKVNGAAVLGVAYLCAVLAIVLTGLATSAPNLRHAPVLMGLGAAGFFLIGSQITLSAYITGFFPTAIRATGVGFNNAFARLGSLLGPAAGGILLGAGVGPSQLIVGSALPGGLSATFLFLLAARQGGHLGQNRRGTDLAADTVKP